MIHRLIMVTLLIFILSCQKKTENSKWSIKATYYEGCSCNAPCPCPFGLPMTNSYCKLNGLLNIHEGKYENIELKGVKAILSGSVGEWGTYYFSETTTKEQILAVEKILATVNIAAFDTILSSKVTKIDYKNENGKVSFSTPNIKVVMDMVKGKNDQPVVVQNLKSKWSQNYTPHLCSKNSRAFTDDSIHNFSFERKAGFSSEWDFADYDFN